MAQLQETDIRVEPSNGQEQDAQQREQFFAVFLRIGDRITTHIAEEELQRGDNVLVLPDGEVTRYLQRDAISLSLRNEHHIKRVRLFGESFCCRLRAMGLVRCILRSSTERRGLRGGEVIVLGWVCRRRAWQRDDWYWCSLGRGDEGSKVSPIREYRGNAQQRRLGDPVGIAGARGEPILIVRIALTDLLASNKAGR